MLIQSRCLRRLTLALGATLLLAWPQAAPTPSPSLPGTLRYVAHWHLLPAGTASLTWSQDGPGGDRHIVFNADSTSLISLFYPVHDHMHSTFDPVQFCTSALDTDSVEGRRQRETHIRFNPDLHQLVLDEVDRAHQPPVAKHEVKPIPGCVHDLFSALDFARAQPLHVGDVYTFPVNEGGATTQVRLTVQLKETVVTPAGRFSAVRAEPTLFDHSVFQRSGSMWVWFSDDARHLPVQIETKVSWGTILAQLTN